MADQTEIVPILSSGVSFKRFLWPYLISSTVIFLVTLIFNLFIIPETNRLKIDFENEVQSRGLSQHVAARLMGRQRQAHRTL